MNNKEYWDNYYKEKVTPDFPSSFAEYCVRRIPYKTTKILDVGCGNGRDSLYFGDKFPSINVVGVDYSIEAVNKINLAGKSNVRAICHDLNEDRSIIDWISPDVIYCRFFLHTIELKLQKQLLRKFLNNANCIFIECRSINDKDKTKYGQKMIFPEGNTNYFGDDHYRRLVNPDDLSSYLQACRCYSVREKAGWAITTKENPLIIRAEAYV